MLVETIELTISHVDLGTLTECATLTLFGDVNSHCLVQGTDVTLSGVTDTDGNTLYPGYYTTHLRVPPARPLSSFDLWDRVAVGCELKSFGGMILDSTYILGSPDEVGDDPDDWDLDALPSMRGGAVFVVEGSRLQDPQPAVPKRGLVAQLPKLRTPPPTVAEFQRVQGRGTATADFDGNLRNREPILYHAATGRDLAPGHGLMFASFTKVMEQAERKLLEEHLFPAFPIALTRCLSVVERLTYYLDNVYDDQVIVAAVQAKMLPAPAEWQTGLVGEKAAAKIEFQLELYDQRTNRQLIAARSTKMLRVPTARKMLLRDVEKLLSVHGGAS